MSGSRRGTPNIVEFVTDPQLLGLSISPAQETLLRGIYGLPMSDHQLELYRVCTGRREPPSEPFGEVTVIAGARSGKDSRIAAPIVLYEALFGGHETHLARGERGVIPLVAQDQRATKVAFGYVRGALNASSLLREMVTDEFSLEIVMTSGLSIMCFPSTLRSLRGWSIPVGVMDEVAFYRLEGQADSDAEIQASIRRGMLSFPQPRLVKISTPYLRSGVLWEDYRRHWSQESSDVLVWRASSQLMNPLLKAERLEQERRKDPDRFQREYEADFTENLQAFLRSDTIDAAVVRDRWELPPLPHVRYTAAVDPSGGGPDAFTLAIVHVEGDRLVQDVMRGWTKVREKSVDLKAIVHESAEILRRYGLQAVVGDRYAGEWAVQAFRDQRIHYYPSRWTKADAYLAVESLLLQGRVELLEHRELIRELGLLERRYHPAGRVSVDHPAGGYHDDHANALALAAMIAEHTRPREEAERPESPTDLYLDRRREEEIAKFKRDAAARGIDPAVIDSIEATVGRDQLQGYVEDMLEANTLKGRLRRAGLL